MLKIKCYALLATIGSCIKETGIIRELEANIFVLYQPYGVANAWLFDLNNFSSHVTKDSCASGASMKDPPFQNSYTFKWLVHWNITSDVAGRKYYSGVTVSMVLLVNIVAHSQ